MKRRDAGDLDRFDEAQDLVKAGDKRGLRLLGQMVRDGVILGGRQDLIDAEARLLVAELYDPSADMLNYKAALEKTDYARKKWARMSKECDLVGAVQQAMANEGINKTKAVEKVAIDTQGWRDMAAYTKRLPAWLKATGKK